MIVTIIAKAKYLYTDRVRSHYSYTWEIVDQEGKVVTNSWENPEEVVDNDWNVVEKSEWNEEFDAIEAGREVALRKGYIVREED